MIADTGMRGTLEMTTRGGMEVYTHPLVSYKRPAYFYDSGWYAWFADVATVAHFNTSLYCPFVLPMSLAGQSF